MGYFGGIFLPSAPREGNYPATPNAAMSARINAFLNQQMKSMKPATPNLFDIFRLSAAALIGQAAPAVLGVTQEKHGAEES